MWLILLEAGTAMFLLIFIVWWTMFSGKRPPPRPIRHMPAERAEPSDLQTEPPQSSKAAGNGDGAPPPAP